MEKQERDVTMTAPRDVLYEAIAYVLDRVQLDPNVHYYCGYGTEVFYRLCVAEADHLGESLDVVERRRRESRIPHHREQRPEVEILRDHLDALRAGEHA